MKNTYYFPHDYHARHDPKLSALIKNFGMEGYGVYWDFIEILHEQGGKIEKFPKLYEGLAHELNINEATLKQIISASISDFRLLQEDETHIWSDRVMDNIETMYRKRTQKVEAGRLGGIKSGEKRSKMKQDEAPLEANELKERKGKERKVNNIRAIPPQEFILSLKTKPEYKHIAIDTELAKMDTWIAAHPGRRKTPRFVLRWLNKIEAPLPTNTPKTRIIA